MPQFVTLPYLPTAKVTHILAGTGMQSYEKVLADLNIACVYSEPISKITGSVKAHIDLAVFPFGGKDFLLERTQHRLFAQLLSLGAQPQYAQRRVENGYPQEASLNCVRIGDRLFGNPKTVDTHILKWCAQKALPFCCVKQGYTKCSVIAVTESALITDDIGIARTANADKLDVLYVDKGSVRLQGYPYGFIGGCASLISNDCMLFTGNVQNHANADSIIAFLRNYHIFPESLTNGALTDIGSFIPLFQQEGL